MKGEAACGLWKRDNKPQAVKEHCMCGTERFGEVKVCRTLPLCPLVLLQSASPCKFKSKPKHCMAAIIQHSMYDEEMCL